jgi:hypothetical protein
MTVRAVTMTGKFGVTRHGNLIAPECDRVILRYTGIPLLFLFFFYDRKKKKK